MKQAFSYYADGVISKIVGVVLAAVFLSYYARGTNLVLLSLIVGFCASELYLTAASRKAVAAPIPHELAFALCSLGNARGGELLCSLEPQATASNGVAVKGETAVAWRISFSPLSADSLVEAYSIATKSGARRLTALCNAVSPDALAYAASNGITVLTLSDSVDALYSLGYRPPLLSKKPRPSIKRALLNKTRAKSLLICAVALLLASSRVKFSGWYVACSLALFVIVALSVREKRN